MFLLHKYPELQIISNAGVQPTIWWNARGAYGFTSGITSLFSVPQNFFGNSRARVQFSSRSGFFFYVFINWHHLLAKLNRHAFRFPCPKTAKLSPAEANAWLSANFANAIRSSKIVGSLCRLMRTEYPIRSQSYSSSLDSNDIKVGNFKFR
jgi:hypothetical protein